MNRCQYFSILSLLDTDIYLIKQIDCFNQSTDMLTCCLDFTSSAFVFRVEELQPVSKDYI